MEDLVGWKLNAFVVDSSQSCQGKSWRYQRWGRLPAKGLLEARGCLDSPVPGNRYHLGKEQPDSKYSKPKVGNPRLDNFTGKIVGGGFNRYRAFTSIGSSTE